MAKVKMLKSLIGTPSYRKGAVVEIPDDQAHKWVKGGLCELLQKKVSAKHRNTSTRKRAAKQKRG